MHSSFDEYVGRLDNVAAPLLAPSTPAVRGQYTYYHFLADGIDDRGWGCGYRSLQTLASWCQHQFDGSPAVPSHSVIQTTIVNAGMEPASFVGSSNWIGSMEVSTVLEQLFGIPCRILTVSSGDQVPAILEQLASHLDNEGSPVMIGGATGYALTLVAVDVENSMVLVLDPHYTGPDHAKQIVGTRWCSWCECSALFPPGAFFNFCLPCASQYSPPSKDNQSVAEVAQETDWTALMCVTSEDHSSMQTNK